MRLYELVVILRSTLKDAERKKLIDAIKGWLKEVKIKKETDWGQKPLAYPIKREAAGHYYFWQLESETGLSKELEQRILGNENVIRHLLLRTK